ncbi:MAG: UTP--glucose-1-phosphate uridylyltransferase [Dehalococcoidia bacterium]
MVQQVRKAVVLAAGLGTRMLPATKSIPKEMLPVVDKPLIQYAVEEAAAAGIEDVIFVVAEGKQAIAEHFGHTTRTEAAIKRQGDAALLELVQHPSHLARYEYVLQDAPKGIAHAIACAREYVEGEPFALLFPDDLIIANEPCIGQMIGAYVEGSMIAVQEVVFEDIPQYGIVDPRTGGNPAPLKGVVEKPRAEDAPSRLGIVGRYLLGATIFEHIDAIPPGKNGELQITDALAHQIAAGELVTAFSYEGVRYDTGRPLGYLVANVAVALGRESLGPALRRRLAEIDATRMD